MLVRAVGSESAAEVWTGVGGLKAPVVLSASEWAGQQFGQVNLGDKRLNRRTLEIGSKMAEHPDYSLPNQMEGRSATIGAYGLLNNKRVTMEALLQPHCKQTLAAAGRIQVVLMVEDTTELDYTAHPSKKGLGPIGDGKGQGLLLHSTLAVIPEGKEILGLTHAQVVLRQPAPPRRPHRSGSPEGQVWEVSAQTVGSPPEGVLWVHVSDRDSDIFEYMMACLDRGKHFLVRAFHNRVLSWEDEEPQMGEAEAHLLDYVRSLPAQPGVGYIVHVEARNKQAAREAQVVLQWTQVLINPPVKGPKELRQRAPITAWVLRVWEPDAPTGAEPVEWILLSSLPITTKEEAYRAVDWYSCRWLCEDFHQCIKTGCHVEKTQLDDGEDVKRLLGFVLPIGVRLLQLRQAARNTPDLPAVAVVEPLMVEVLGRRKKKDVQNMTIAEFWKAVAGLGGHQGRRSDGPPGWRTVWRGWCKLADLTEGARLYAPV